MRNEEEIDATVAELPQTIDWLPGKLRAIGAFKEELLVYREARTKDWLTGETGKAVQVTCTSCGDTFLAEKMPANGCHNSYAPAPFGYFDHQQNDVVISGDACMCPLCGAKAEAKHIGRFRTFGDKAIISEEMAATVHTVHGHLVFLTWVVRRCADKYGNTFFIIDGVEGVIVVDRKPVRVVKRWNNMGGTVYMEKWAWRKQYREEIGRAYKERVFLAEDIDVTVPDLDRSAFLDYISGKEESHIFPGAYIAAWCQYPNIENLVRRGYSRYLTHCIAQSTHTSWQGYSARDVFTVRDLAEHINVKAAKPHEMLGCDKQELAVFAYHQPETADVWKMLKERGTRIPLQEIGMLEVRGRANFAGWNELTKDGDFIGFRVPVLRTMHYIAKQNEKHKMQIDVMYMRDYWQLLWKLDGRIDPAMAFPKNVIREHDRVNDLIVQRENEEKKKKLAAELKVLDEKIAKIAEGLEEQCFADDETGLCIRPCRSATELIDEGAALHHCVGTYRNKVAQGLTMIYFVRWAESPNTPYYTLELLNGKIEQDHGDKNVLQTETIKQFEIKWLAHLASLKEKGAKHGKRTASAEKSERRPA